jgi:hypothetical protein
MSAGPSGGGAPGGAGASPATPSAAAAGDTPQCAHFMLAVDRQLRALKARMLLRLDQGARLDRGARDSGERWRAALTAAPPGSYARPTGPAQEAAARELERAVLGALLAALGGATAGLPMLATSLHNMVRGLGWGRDGRRACLRRPNGARGGRCGAWARPAPP